jgi:hypothetical protein
MSFQVIVGCIVTRSPSSSMAPTAFIELGLACDLFEKGAKFSRRARSGLVSSLPPVHLFFSHFPSGHLGQVTRKGIPSLFSVPQRQSYTSSRIGVRPRAFRLWGGRTGFIRRANACAGQQVDISQGQGQEQGPDFERILWSFGVQHQHFCLES